MSAFGPTDFMNQAGSPRSGGPSAFRRHTIYDAPGLAISNALEGRVGLDTMRGILFDPDSLSLEQRISLSDRVSQGRGSQTSIEKMAIGVATNPWVWAWFLTSPVGGQALSSTGKGLFNSVAKKYASQNKESMGITSWFKSSMQEFTGSGLDKVSLHTSDKMLHLGEADMMLIVDAQQDLMKKLSRMAQVPDISKTMIMGATDALSSGSYRKGSRSHTIVHSFELGMESWQQGLDKAQDIPIKQLVKTYMVRDGMRGGKWRNLDEAFDATGMGLPAGASAKEELAVLLQKKMRDRADELRTQWNSSWDKIKDKSGAVPAAEKQQLLAEMRILSGARPGAALTKDDYAQFLERNGIQIVEDARQVITDSTKTQSQMLRGDKLNLLMDQFGDEGWGYIAATKRAKQFAYVRALGDETEFARTGQFLADDEKSAAWVYALTRGAKEGLPGGLTSIQGQEAMMAAVGPDRFRELVEGLTADPWKYHNQSVKTVQDLITPADWNGRWGSKNLFAGVRVNDGAGGFRAPRMGKMEATAAEMSPYASFDVRNSKTARVMPLTEKEVLFDPDSLTELEKLVPNILTDAGREHIEKVRNIATNRFKKDGGITLAVRLAGPESHNRYMGNMRHVTAYDTSRVTKEVLEAEGVAIKNVIDNFEIENRRTYRKGLEVSVQTPFDEGEYVTAGMLFDRAIGREKSVVRQQYIRDKMVPSALNNAGIEYMATYNSQMQQKQIANWFANDFLGKTIEKMGEGPKKFIEGMRQFGDFSERPTPNNMVGAMAGWLYTTHLGINMASVVLNITQPLLLAASVGRLDDVLVAYGRAMGEMWNYAKDRVAAGGVFMDPVKKRAMLNKNFKYTNIDGVDVLGIGPDFHDLFDWQIKNTGTKFDKFVEVMMKGFEKSEHINRNVTAHLYGRVVERTGGQVRALDAKRFVLETQFGNSPVNTPRMFQEGPLGNALLRQFMTFPLRSFVGTWSTFPQLGGGENAIKNVTNMVVRGMGLSAVMNEVGKGLWGGDMTRGLFAASATDLLGGNRFIKDERSWIPVPPIADIPVGIIRGVATNDLALMSDSVARLIPGGVAINRVLGITGQMPESGALGLTGRLQKTYAAWDQPMENGMVPVFRGDGTLVEYRSPTELWARAAGVDLGSFNQQGGLDGYLTKQRELIAEHRRRYLNALRRNDPQTAIQLAAQFESKFGIPLTVTPEQVKAFTRGQFVGRTERIVDRLPEEVRAQYLQLVKQTDGMRNVRGAGFDEMTSTNRDPYRAQMEQMIRNQNDLTERVNAVGRAAADQGGTRENSFDSYRP